jgi:hypothetical protein
MDPQSSPWAERSSFVCVCFSFAAKNGAVKEEL